MSELTNYSKREKRKLAKETKDKNLLFNLAKDSDVIVRYNVYWNPHTGWGLKSRLSVPSPIANFFGLGGAVRVFSPRKRLE